MIMVLHAKDVPGYIISTIHANCTPIHYSMSRIQHNTTPERGIYGAPKLKLTYKYSRNSPGQFTWFIYGKLYCVFKHCDQVS